MPDGRRGFCRDCIAVKGKEYRDKFPDAVAASKRRWAERNQERTREIARGTRLRQRQRLAAEGESYTARVRDRYPETYANLMAKWAKRRADRVRATPAWFEAEKVRSIYRQAGRMRKAGFDVHVDHIYPLRGATVCGLHVHTNLRIIPAAENISKGAKMIQMKDCNNIVAVVSSAPKN